MVGKQKDRSGLEKIFVQIPPTDEREREAIGKIEKLRERSKKGEIITLLCHYRSDEHCHRYIIKSKIIGSSKVIERD